MISQLYNHINYTSNVNYIISSFITEYDISKANINVLLNKGVININKYNELYNLDRMERQISVGLLLKDNKEYSDILKNGIIEFKKKFFEANNVQDSDVLLIRNDAIFLVNKKAINNKFDNIIFVPKNVYTSYYSIYNKRLSLYYYYNQINDVELLDVKGISDNVLHLHEEYFLEFLKVLFNSAETEKIEDTIELIVSFYNKYLRLELETEYYRNFDAESLYYIKSISKFHNFKANVIQESKKKYLNISCNLNIIRELHQIYSGIYFSRNR